MDFIDKHLYIINKIWYKAHDDCGDYRRLKITKKDKMYQENFKKLPLKEKIHTLLSYLRERIHEQRNLENLLDITSKDFPVTLSRGSQDDPKKHFNNH